MCVKLEFGRFNPIMRKLLVNPGAWKLIDKYIEWNRRGDARLWNREGWWLNECILIMKFHLHYQVVLLPFRYLWNWVNRNDWHVASSHEVHKSHLDFFTIQTDTPLNFFHLRITTRSAINSLLELPILHITMTNVTPRLKDVNFRKFFKRYNLLDFS